MHVCRCVHLTFNDVDRCTGVHLTFMYAVAWILRISDRRTHGNDGQVYRCTSVRVYECAVQEENGRVRLHHPNKSEANRRWPSRVRSDVPLVNLDPPLRPWTALATRYTPPCGCRLDVGPGPISVESCDAQCDIIALRAASSRSGRCLPPRSRYRIRTGDVPRARARFTGPTR